MDVLEAIITIVMFCFMTLAWAAIGALIILFAGMYVTWNVDFTIVQPYGRYLFRFLLIPSIYVGYHSTLEMKKEMWGRK